MFAGLEKGFDERPDVGPYVKLTKQVLLGWAWKN